MRVNHVLAVQIVRDHETAVDWYSRLLAREPDRRPMEPSAEWDTGAARRGIEGEAHNVPSGQFRLCVLEDPSENMVVLSEKL